MINAWSGRNHMYRCHIEWAEDVAEWRWSALHYNVLIGTGCTETRWGAKRQAERFCRRAYRRSLAKSSSPDKRIEDWIPEL